MITTTIENARYVFHPDSTENSNIMATIDGEDMCIPLEETNRYYQEIMKQVEAGELTIQAADEE